MIIIDASVGIKWIKRDEKDSEKSFLLYKSHIENTTQINIPHFFYLEVANALVSKTSFSNEDIKNGLSFLYKASLLSIYFAEEELIFAAKLSKQYKTSVYDMIYAVIAKKQKTILITADEKFIKKTKFPFVKLLSEYSLK